MFKALVRLDISLSLFPYAATTARQGTIYEPNQNVLACGFIDPSAGPIRIRSNVAKNLNSGDHIDLVVGARESGGKYEGVVTYAVAYK